LFCSIFAVNIVIVGEVCIVDDRFSSKTMTILTAKIEQNNNYINNKNRAKQ
jgi:hypothetical protein